VWRSQRLELQLVHDTEVPPADANAEQVGVLVGRTRGDEIDPSEVTTVPRLIVLV